MADRKVLVKYYPPDFDFDKLQAHKRTLKNYERNQKRKKGNVYNNDPKRHTQRVMNVRMMYPFTLRCGTCREFIYVGTKFNSRVERVQGEDYLGIEKWRFYGRCTQCRAEICFKTDPQNCDYVLEWGGTRIYDPLKDQAMAAERLQKEKEAELEGNRIRQVEANRFSMQAEVAAIEQLEELRRINKRLVDKNAAANSALNFLKKNQLTSQDIAEEESTERERQELLKYKDLKEKHLMDESGSELSESGQKVDNQTIFQNCGESPKANKMGNLLTGHLVSDASRNFIETNNLKASGAAKLSGSSSQIWGAKSKHAMLKVRKNKTLDAIFKDYISSDD